MKKKFLFLLLYYLSPILPIMANYKFHPEYYENIENLMAMIFGSCAFTWLILEFVLIARIKILEQSFGLDKFYKFHGIMAMISIILVFFHKNLKWESESGDLAFNLYLFIIFLAVVFMTNTLSQYLKPLDKLKKSLQKFHITKYELQVIVHNLTFIALIIMFFHVINVSSAKENTMLRIIYIIYFTIAISCYIYHKLVKPIFIIKKYNLNYKKNENYNILTLGFSPIDKKNVFNYKPGQFAFLKIKGLKTKEEHPFTISSSPENKNELTFTIKELGDFTKNIKNLSNNITAKIDGPYGIMSFLNYRDEENLFFLSGGIGITPILSMLRYLNSINSTKKICLIWGIRTSKDLICKNEIESISQNLKNFTFIPITYKDENWKGLKGSITRKIISDTLKENSFKIEKTGFYICGPKKMMSSSIKSIKELNVKNKNIHFEKFSL
jgi:predicted ferric reductase